MILTQDNNCLLNSKYFDSLLDKSYNCAENLNENLLKKYLNQIIPYKNDFNSDQLLRLIEIKNIYYSQKIDCELYEAEEHIKSGDKKSLELCLLLFPQNYFSKIDTSIPNKKEELKQRYERLKKFLQ